MNDRFIITSDNRLHLYLVWLVYVSINAAISLYLAFDLYKASLDRYGIVTGLLSFVILYAELDRLFITSKNFDFHKILVVSVVLKAATQLLPIIEIGAGICATYLVESLIGNVPFLSVYLQTMIDGAILSVVVAIISVPTRIAFRAIKNRHLIESRISAG